MSKLRLHGTSSGYTDIAPTAAAGNNTLTAPTGTGTLVAEDSSGNISISEGLVHTGDTNTKIKFPAADTVTVETAGSERLRISDAGVVGVRVTPEAWHSDRRVIQVGGSALSGMTPADGQELALTNNGYFDTTDNRWEFIASDDASGIFMSNGGIFFKRSPASGSADAVLSWATSLTINDSGKVGIGTNSLDGKLCVWSGTAGSVSANSDADELVLESSGNVGVSLLTAGTGESSIYFGNPGTNGEKDGWVKYYHESHYETSNRRSLSFKAGGGQEKVRITANGYVGIGTSAVSGVMVHVNAPANATDAALFNSNYVNRHILVRETSDGNSNSGIRIQKRHSTLHPANHWYGNISFEGWDGSGYHKGALIEGVAFGTPANNSMPGNLRFSTNGGASSPTERMRIHENGAVTIGPSPSGKYFDDGKVWLDNVDNHTAIITHGGSTDFIPLHIRQNRATGSTSGGMIRFLGAGGVIVGNITSTGSATTYSTSSDYRLKENVIELSDAITRLKTLKPYRFNFKSNPSTTVDGFLAHEVTTVPEAISGEKDATQTLYYAPGDTIPDGKKEGDVKEENAILPQSIDQSKLVPLLTAALQEAIKEIEDLKVKVAALESA